MEAEISAPAAAPSLLRLLRSRGDLVLLALGLIWLAITLWGAHGSIKAAATQGETVALGSQASSLPGVIAASLLAGLCAGLVAVGRLTPLLTARSTSARSASASSASARSVSARPASARSVSASSAGASPASVGWPARVGAALGGGAVVGLVAGALVLLAYGTTSALVVLAVTVFAAGLLGGAAALAPTAAITAGTSATVAVLIVGAIFSAALQNPLVRLFGGKADDPASEFAAGERFAYLQSAICGLIAGLVAFYLLKRTPGLRFPWFMLAGGLPGLLLLLAEGLTRTGGARLLDLVKQLDVLDQGWVEYNDGARLRHALITGFLGAIIAMIMFGRTLPPQNPSSPPR